jgi:dTDP-glucose 4,6-dehydratase
LNILVCGGAGFIGTNYILQSINSFSSDANFRVLDKLTYAGSFEPFLKTKIEIVHGDICDQNLMQRQIDWADIVINFAAESHVDNSIKSAIPFVKANVLGAQNIFEIASKLKDKYVVQISTDEVYGSKVSGDSYEGDAFLPNSPYSASKASADLFARAYEKTFDLKLMTIRPCNNFGPYQNVEKFIPLSITKLISGEKITIYGDGSNVREWIFVAETCKIINLLIKSEQWGEVFNIGSGFKLTNIDLVRKICEKLKAPYELISFIDDRPGHDFRYSLDVSKLNNLGIDVPDDFDSNLEKTIEWFVDNKSYWSARK